MSAGGTRLGSRFRIGIDLGGTKIAGICLDGGDLVVGEARRATPRDDYDGTILAIRAMVAELEQPIGAAARVGVGMPGSLAPATGRVQNANSTWLNDRPFGEDLSGALGRPVRCANDANCFILSEAHDGAAAGAESAFGVIIGTGCGGGLVIGGRLVEGARRIGGEWGHNPLPWPDERDGEVPGPTCWCGRQGCLETWVSGPALAADHARATGRIESAEAVVALARAGCAVARDTLRRHASRLARGLAAVVNLCDPQVIVLGGGLCEIDELYGNLPALIAPFIFAADRAVTVVPPRWGAASGVRGAARLWP